MSSNKRLSWLKVDGVIGTYTDKDGNLVIQHDGSRTIEAIVNDMGEDPDDVEEVSGGFKAHDRKSRHRPVPMGVSHGAQDVTAGSTGVLVEKNGVGPFVDTNLHVAGGKNVEKDEPIDQQGEYDQPEEVGETLYEYGWLGFYVPINEQVPWWWRYLNGFLDLINSSVQATFEQQARHDAALVFAYEEDGVTKEIFGADGYPDRIEAAPLGTICTKSGRTTGITKMEKVSSDWTGTVMEPWGPVTFIDQNLYKGVNGKSSAGGDSGSTICWDEWSAVDGRLFAGNSKQNITIGNPYDHFAEEYNVSLY